MNKKHKKFIDSICNSSIDEIVAEIQNRTGCDNVLVYIIPMEELFICTEEVSSGEHYEKRWRIH